MINPITLYFETFIQKMGNVFIVDDPADVVYDNVDNCTIISMECTSYMSDCSIIDINGSDHEVKSFVFDESITVNGDLTGLLPLEITVKPPFYIYGEVTATNAELSRIDDSRDRTPMVYMNTPTREDFNTDIDSPVDRVVDIRLFLLDENKSRDWKTKEHWTDAIRSMYFMADQLCDIVDNDPFVPELITKQITGYAKIGDLVSSDNLSNLFSQSLSGVELRLSFPIHENEKCKC